MGTTTIRKSDMKLRRRKDGTYATKDGSAWVERDTYSPDWLHLSLRQSTGHVTQHVFLKSVREAQTVLDLDVAIRDLILEHGGRTRDAYVIHTPDMPNGVFVTQCRDYQIETKYGLLGVSVHGNWVACVFAEEKQAATGLSSRELNAYSGKWNHGCGMDLTTEQMVSTFRLALRRVLPTKEV